MRVSSKIEPTFRIVPQDRGKRPASAIQILKINSEVVASLGEETIPGAAVEVWWASEAGVVQLLVPSTNPLPA